MNGWCPVDSLSLTLKNQLITYSPTSEIPSRNSKTSPSALAKLLQVSFWFMQLQLNWTIIKIHEQIQRCHIYKSYYVFSCCYEWNYKKCRLMFLHKSLFLKPYILLFILAFLVIFLIYFLLFLCVLSLPTKAINSIFMALSWDPIPVLLVPIVKWNRICVHLLR